MDKRKVFAFIDTSNIWEAQNIDLLKIEDGIWGKELRYREQKK